MSKEKLIEASKAVITVYTQDEVSLAIAIKRLIEVMREMEIYKG